MRVYLTGFMGAGKSTVGSLLAAELGCPFVDLDAAIENAAGQAIGDIFANSGEGRFRQLESAQLRLTARTEACVVATGGGTPVDAANRRWMRDHGTIVWLEADFDLLRERVRNSAVTNAATQDAVSEGTVSEISRARPLWRDSTRAREHFDRRQLAYRDCDLPVETASKSASQVALEIAEALASAGLR